jgi:hypothetical protein
MAVEIRVLSRDDEAVLSRVAAGGLAAALSSLFRAV